MSENRGHAGEHTADDESAVRQVVASFAEEWNHHEPQAMVQNFADQLSHVSVRGHWQHTQAELEQTFRRNHAGIWAQVTFTPVVEEIRFLRPDVAVAVVHGTFRSAGGAEEIARSTWVFSREAGRWLIRAFQQTYVQDVPIAPADSA